MKALPDVRAQVVASLLAEFDLAVERALPEQLRSTDESTYGSRILVPSAARSCRAR